MNQISSYLLLGFEGTDSDFLITFGLGGAAVTIRAGVRHARPPVIRLSDIRDADRQSTADFIKSRLRATEVTPPIAVPPSARPITV